MAKLLIDESPLQVQPTIATWVGLNEALILQQLNYWFNKKGKPMGQTDEDDQRWIRMSLPDWCENFPFFDEGQIRRALTNLLKDNLLLRRQFTGRSFWYRINHEALDTLSGPVDRKAALQQKRKSAASNALDKRLSEQSVQIENDDDTDENDNGICTKCSDVSVQSVQTICTKCSASKTTPKTTSKSSLPNGNGDKSPPKNKASSKKEKLSKHPAIQAFRGAMERYPAKNVYRDIINTVGEDQKDIDWWGDVVKAWKLCPYSPKNYLGMLECFKSGELPDPQKNGATNGYNKPKGNKAANSAGPAQSGATLDDQPYWDIYTGKLVTPS